MGATMRPTAHALPANHASKARMLWWSEERKSYPILTGAKAPLRPCRGPRKTMLCGVVVERERDCAGASADRAMRVFQQCTPFKHCPLRRAGTKTPIFSRFSRKNRAPFARSLCSLKGVRARFRSRKDEYELEQRDPLFRIQHSALNKGPLSTRICTCSASMMRHLR